MTDRLSTTLIASLSAVTLLFAANAASARSGAITARGSFASTHAMSHHFPFRHQHRGGGGVFPFWPGDFDYAPDYSPNGEPLIGGAPPASNDVRYTSTYDVPWDWAHRFPPMVAPSDHPYVPSCPTETVTVPGRDGGDRSVNVTRCY